MSQHRSRLRLDDLLDAQIWHTMLSLGWIEPLDEASLQAIEVEVERALASGHLHLPKTLESPDAIFAKLNERQDRAISLDSAIQEQMARAAREGGVIPPDVEEKMRRDRQAAETRHQKGKDYEDLFS
ncbi:MAG: hypothetical protein CMR00_00470 [[Chlorobium] sp. 445]|nr:MAG: hypothetical protein CMR00_00470 [[Chlorobium] sp. 445]